jgi:hypothetical protein
MTMEFMARKKEDFNASATEDKIVQAIAKLRIIIKVEDKTKATI